MRTDDAGENWYEISGNLPTDFGFPIIVHAHEPDTIYGSLVADDGLSFFHAMAFPDEAAERRHAQADYTKRFVDVLYPNCVSPPEFTAVRVIHSTKRGAGFLGVDR